MSHPLYDHFATNFESTASSSSNMPTTYTPVSSGSSELDENAAEQEYRDPSPAVYRSDFPIDPPYPISNEYSDDIFNEPSIHNRGTFPTNEPMNVSRESLSNTFGINSFRANSNNPTGVSNQQAWNDFQRTLNDLEFVNSAAGDTANKFLPINHTSPIFIVDTPVAGPNDATSRPSSASAASSHNSRPTNGRRGRLSDDVRENAAKTRKTGACIPCKRSKQSCDPGPGPCQRCCLALRKAYGSAVSIQPCWRVIITDAELFRRGPTMDFAMSHRGLKSRKQGQEPLWKIFKVAPSEESTSKWVKLTQGWTENTLTLQLDEYQPKPTDKQYYRWFDHGIERHYSTPPYAIAEYDDEIEAFLRENEDEYVRAHMENASEITKRTFETVLAKKKDPGQYLVRLCLKFWVASRLIEKPWRIVGSETLGMQPDTNPHSPYFKRVPVPPVVGNQIDLIVINEQLQRTLKKILQELEKKMMKNKKMDWFEIHLAYFVLLHSVELTMAHDVEFARRYNLSEKFSNTPLINMVSHGACTLLTLFHHAHRGSLPFCSDVMNSSSDFRPEEKEFVQDVSSMVWYLKSEGGRVDDPAKELFWTSQLYHTQWSPVSICV